MKHFILAKATTSLSDRVTPCPPPSQTQVNLRIPMLAGGHHKTKVVGIYQMQQISIGRDIYHQGLNKPGVYRNQSRSQRKRSSHHWNSLPTPHHEVSEISCHLGKMTEFGVQWLGLFWMSHPRQVFHYESTDDFLKKFPSHLILRYANVSCTPKLDIQLGFFFSTQNPKHVRQMLYPWATSQSLRNPFFIAFTKYTHFSQVLSITAVPVLNRAHRPL